MCNWVDAHPEDVGAPGIYFIYQQYGIYMYVKHSSGTITMWKIVAYNGKPATRNKVDGTWEDWHDLW